MNQIVTCKDALSDGQVGGKFAKQAHMLKADLPVPDFYCLSGDFYKQAIASIESTIRSELAQIDFKSAESINQTSARIKDLFLHLKLQANLEKSILNAHDQFFRQDDLVAVRASTIGLKAEESEDSATQPFAGMSETFLYVRRSEILGRMKECWGSGFSAESLIYRQSQGMDVSGFHVAVGVQRMVFGERSFVLFTADPKTAARDAVIVAGYGIGEGVVQERVGVDHFFVRRKTDEITQVLGTKATKLTLNQAEGHGLIEMPVPADLHETPCFSDSEILSIVAIGDKIEKLFGAPQDIEGTFTPDGKLHVLQSRPIAIDYGRQLVWTNTNVTESYPGVTTALTYTHARYFYRVIFRDAYRRLGVSAETLHENFEPLDKMIGFLNGRVYYCLSHFYLLHKQSPLFPIFRAHWENMIGLQSSFQTHSAQGISELTQKVRQIARTAVAVFQTWFDYIGHDKSMERYHAWWAQRVKPLQEKNFSHEDPYRMVQMFYEVWTEVGKEWGVTLTTDGYLIPLYGLAEHLFKRWDLTEDAGLLSDLLCGDEELLSVEAILSAVNLAERVRTDTSLIQLFEADSGTLIWENLISDPRYLEFRQATEVHLSRFGDRGLQELKMEQPSVRDTPWVLMDMVKQYVDRSVTVKSVRDHESEVRRAADLRLRLLLKKHPMRLFLLEKIILPRLRRLIRHRENSRYCRSELFGFSKQVFKSLARHLHSRGVLRVESDIYHLTQGEIFDYIVGMGVTSNLQAMADLRRAEFDAHLKVEVPDQITTFGAIPDNDLSVPKFEDSGGGLRGLGSSAGRVRGIARVIHDPNTVKELGPNVILIAKETDPGWLFLMLASKGMVVERGSMLSHTAITGRKFGIPTIVALPHATQRIPDGALIEMDGSTGVVTLIEEKLDVAQ